ncbi:MAG: hypothetical protein GF401_00360 [Chitinivibrionales bacterium]|nr:hypothetical protein [Chitinivibrionales bacterium]
METIWVLEVSYDFNKKEIINALQDLLDFEAIQLEDQNNVESALNYFRTGKADFSDYLSACRAFHSHHSKLHTFDKKCREKEFFVRL